MNKKIIIAIVAVVILVGGGIGAAVLILGGNKEKAKTVNYKEFSLEVQYTNIKPDEDTKNGTREKVLKFCPVIKYADSEETFALINSNKTDIVNEFRKYFMHRNKEQLGNLERVQEDLTDIVIETLEADPEQIDNVLFTEFIIQ